MEKREHRRVGPPIYTVPCGHLQQEGVRLTFKVYPAHTIVSSVDTSHRSPIQAQEILTNLESRLLLVLLAFSEGCARALLLAVVRLTQDDWGLLCPQILQHLQGDNQHALDHGDPFPQSRLWRDVLARSEVLAEGSKNEEECRTLWDALTTLRRKLRPFRLVIPLYNPHSGYILCALPHRSFGGEGQAGRPDHASPLFVSSGQNA